MRECIHGNPADAAIKRALANLSRCSIKVSCNKRIEEDVGVEFKVSFIAKDEQKPTKTGFPKAVYIKSYLVGNNAIALMRERAGGVIPLEQIVRHIPGLETNVSIIVDEKIAQEYSVFDITCNVVVEVEKKSLNCYVDECVYIGKDTKTGAVVKAWMELEINRVTILNEWLEAGAPLVWHG